MLDTLISFYTTFTPSFWILHPHLFKTRPSSSSMIFLFATKLNHFSIIQRYQTIFTVHCSCAVKLVCLPFINLMQIKLLSTQPSCLNVRLTSVVHLCGLYPVVVQKIRKSKSFDDKYFSSGRRVIRTVSGLKQRFIKFQSNLIEHN